MSKLGKKHVLLATFVVSGAIIAAFVAALTLWASGSQNMANNEGGIIMADEETVEANAAILLKHFEEIELDDSNCPRKVFAAAGAEWLGRKATNRRLVDVSSETSENSRFTVTVTDEAGETFVLYFDSYGDLYLIKNESGDTVHAVIE